MLRAVLGWIIFLETPILASILFQILAISQPWEPEGDGEIGSGEQGTVPQRQHQGQGIQPAGQSVGLQD